MADFDRTSIVGALRNADRVLGNDNPSLTGKTALTYKHYMASQRSTMFTNHLDQHLTLLEPEFPLVFTGAENLVGKYSHGAYRKVDSQQVIIKKIVKFEGLIPEPTEYVLFIYDPEKDEYDIVQRFETEDLTENFGFKYNTDVIDSYNEGDTIPADTVLYRSTSLDEDMRYRYGINVNTMYSTEPVTSEDAAIISSSLAARGESIENEVVTIKLNDNDFLINLHGTDSDYKPIPDVGESCQGIIAATRTLFNSQLLFDFKADSLKSIHEGDKPTYLHDGIWRVLDITVYCNNEELEETPFTSQIMQYLNAQNAYYQQIQDTCTWIVESGSKYTPDLDYLYKRSMEMLDTKKKWRKGDNVFSNLMLDISICRIRPLSYGQKITGRYGNKSVIAEVRDDEYMPYTEDGRRVDLILNVLAIINRTTAFALYELMITNITHQVRQRMRSFDTWEERERLMFDCIYEFNEEQHDKMWAFYRDLTDDEKHSVLQDVMDCGLPIHQSPVSETTPIFHRINRIMHKYDWLKADVLYVKDKKTGRVVKSMSRQWIGQMYIMKLKQSGLRGFSVRSTGAIDNKGLPARSRRSKHHADRYSDSAVRFGEFEFHNFAIGVPTEDLALFNAFYRTSSTARGNLVHMMFSKGKKIALPKKYKNLAAQLNNVLFRTVGVEFDIMEPDSGIFSLDDVNVSPHTLEDGTSVVCTDYEFFRLTKRAEIRKEVLAESLVLPTDVLEAEVDRRLNELMPEHLK